MFSGISLRKIACYLIQIIALNTITFEQLPWNCSMKELKAHIGINVLRKYQGRKQVRKKKFENNIQASFFQVYWNSKKFWFCTRNFFQLVLSIYFKANRKS